MRNITKIENWTNIVLYSLNNKFQIADENFSIFSQ
jgi:hypothetical protein